MILYTCCPHERCGSHQESLRFLHGNGIEPELGVDDTGHFLEFDIPKYWKKTHAIAFRKQFFRRVKGLVICYCGEFWSDPPNRPRFTARNVRRAARSSWSARSAWTATCSTGAPTAMKRRPRHEERQTPEHRNATCR